MLRVAVIGVSHWHAPRHVAGLRAAGAAIVGVSDPEEARAQAFARDLGCPAFADYRSLIETTKPDFIFAMARHCDASALLDNILDTGLPLGMEKPLGLNAAEVAPLAEKARRRGSQYAGDRRRFSERQEWHVG